MIIKYQNVNNSYLNRVNDMKLIWGHPGFVDGYGQHGTVEFFRDPANLALIGLTKSSIDISLSNAARINHDPEIQVSSSDVNITKI